MGFNSLFKGLKIEGKCWPEFYKYVKWRKVYRENIPSIKDCNG
jgi:hypothetical protein